MWQWEIDLTNLIKSEKWRIGWEYKWQATGEFLFIIVFLGLIIIPWFIKEEHWSMRLMMSGVAICIALVAVLIITAPK